MIDEKKLIDDLKQSGMIADNEYENAMVDMIESQPKISGWIPCSERLPDKGDNYIIHTITGTGEDYVGMWLYELGVHLSGKQTYIDDKQGYWASPYNGDAINEHLSKNVVAWQPLPEAYHG